MHRVLKREMLVPNIHLLVVESNVIPRNAQAGQFVVVRVNERGERIPLNLVDWDSESVTMVFMEVGTSTRRLAQLEAGDMIADIVGPLGRPTVMPSGKRVMAIGGCYGIAGISPVLRAFRQAGNRLTTVIEARSAGLLYGFEHFGEVSDVVVEITRDGSRGRAGHVDDFLREFLARSKPDLVYVQGCAFLSYLVSSTTRPYGVSTVVSLNPIMIDATGMCGVCRCRVGGKTRFACVDGPEFNGHEVDWENLRLRRQAYLGDERRSLSFYECDTYG